MFVLGNPNGVVQTVNASSSFSGGVIAYDKSNNQWYKNNVGSTWIKLGSVA